ncbi:hypothetical protein LPJ61_004087 [Coemansia biformis]|uniref:Uncharacterized protein n=1 Tax=Coemansia biformis TaxID=1286918 RepID=A0A9W8CXL9_9FUNG|nr:hypothetical protein LPJ61_004087 [Coemansia biformis]
MRLSLIVAQALAASVLAAPAVFKRQSQGIEAETGDSVSGGPAAVSNPNVNNGDQVDGSLIVNGSEDGDFINNAFGNSITHVNSNQANKGNLVINPSVVTSNGNDGWTANGNQNHLGDSQDVIPGLWRRDAVFTNVATTNARFAHDVPLAYYPQVFYTPPVAAYPAGYPAAHVSDNRQQASIVQNQA